MMKKEERRRGENGEQGKVREMVSDERGSSLGRERKGQCEMNAKKNGKALTEARRHREK